MKEEEEEEKEEEEEEEEEDTARTQHLLHLFELVYAMGSPFSIFRDTSSLLNLHYHKQPFASSFSPPLLLRLMQNFFYTNVKNNYGVVCHLDFYFRFECMREFRKLLF